jgi:hypothetical protein
MRTIRAITVTQPRLRRDVLRVEGEVVFQLPWRALGAPAVPQVVIQRPQIDAVGAVR